MPRRATWRLTPAVGGLLLSHVVALTGLWAAPIEFTNGTAIYPSSGDTSDYAGSGVLTVVANIYNSSRMSGTISDSGGVASLVKTGGGPPGRDLGSTGGGTLTMTGANTYTGSTTVLSRTLHLDFTAGGAPTEDILYHGVTAGELILGTASFPGRPSVPDLSATYQQTGGVQHFGGLTLSPGGNKIVFTAGYDAFLSLGEITRARASYLDVPVNSNPTSTSAIRTTTTNTNGILGAWATAGTDWAANDGTGNIVPFTGYVAPAEVGGVPVINSDAGQNVRITTEPSGPVHLAGPGVTDMNTLMITGPFSGTLAIEAGQTLRLGDGGGIWVQSTGAAWNIGAPGTGGTLVANSSAGETGEIILRHNVIVNATIADNPGGGATALSVNGDSVALTAANTYSGGTVVSSGTVNAASATSLGTGPVYIGSAARVVFAPDAGVVTNDFDLSPVVRPYDNGYTELPAPSLSGGTTLGTSASTIHLSTIGAIGGTDTVIAAKITGAGAAWLTGTVALANPLNDYSGGTQINGGYVPTVLTIGAEGVIPHGVGNGNVTIVQSRYQHSAVTLDINGHDTTINGLSSYAFTSYEGTGRGPVTLTNGGAAGLATLTVGDGNGSGTYSGGITDGPTAKLALNKIGSGTQTMRGTLDYTGGTTVSEGILAVSGSIAGSVMVKPGGTFFSEYSIANASNISLQGAGISQHATFAPGGGVQNQLQLDSIGDALSPGLGYIANTTFTTSQNWSAFTYKWDEDSSLAGSDQITIEGALGLTGGPGSYILEMHNLGSTFPYLEPPQDMLAEIVRTWDIIKTTGGITGFDASQWLLDTSGLNLNPNLTGVFTLAQNGDNLQLQYTAQQVPEPSSAALVTIFIIGAAIRRRKR
ncbi:MAG: autotransporter-associated beta strand repeat-containing protein [Verrucomicrobiaceae bacterium]|nr:autotransporter-associated beta strand repeat-containing protein [Verrucomicrobiaceae bacterium]